MAENIDITPCIDPTKPPHECLGTAFFGYPRGVADRPVAIQGIAIHCLNVSLAAYDDKVCSNAEDPPSDNHASMHYAVGGDGQIHQYVDDEDIAWAFDIYNSNFPVPLTPPYTYPGWPTLSAANSDYPIDFYTINVGVAVADSTRPPTPSKCDDPCEESPFGMTVEGYRELIHLLAYLANRYSIPINEEHIAFHSGIEDLPDGEKDCRCRRTMCLVCDVNSYCEGCVQYRDSSYALDTTIKFIYGENEDGCKVKICLPDLKVLLDALP